MASKWRFDYTAVGSLKKQRKIGQHGLIVPPQIAEKDGSSLPIDHRQ